MAETFDYCLSEGILGVGWRTKTNKNTNDWEIFYSEAITIHDNLNTCKYMKTWVGEGCLVWTRDPHGTYYLARVLSGWEYFTTEESIRKDIDIGNVFRVSFERIDIDEVPGKVVASFRPNRTLQEIADPTAVAYSKFLWNKRAGAEVYALDNATINAADIFSFLDSEEAEDLVFLYLQSLGWFVVPNSRKADTLAFEYMVVKPGDGSRAQVQVKTGTSVLDRNAYRDHPDPVILFQSSGLYVGEPSTNVTCLSRVEIDSFLEASMHWLPARYRLKMAMLPRR